MLSVLFCVCQFLCVQIAAGQTSKDPCGLPKDLQGIVEGRYRGTKIVTLSDLNEDDKKLFQSQHDADECPGLVKIDFFGDGKPVLAFALTIQAQVPSTRLIMAHEVGKKWKIAVLDKADGPVPVVWSESAGEYTGLYGKKIHAIKPVIIFCGYDSWAILYAWTNDRIAKIWLRD